MLRAVYHSCFRRITSRVSPCFRKSSAKLASLDTRRKYLGICSSWITSKPNFSYSDPKLDWHIRWSVPWCDDTNSSTIARATPLPRQVSLTAIEANSMDPSRCGLICPQPMIFLSSVSATTNLRQSNPVGLMRTRTINARIEDASLEVAARSLKLIANSNQGVL